MAVDCTGNAEGFATALRLLDERAVDVRPLIQNTCPLPARSNRSRKRTGGTG